MSNQIGILLLSLVIFFGAEDMLAAQPDPLNGRGQLLIMNDDLWRDPLGADKAQSQSAKTDSQSRVGKAKRGGPARSGLSLCPDYSLKREPQMPISVKFLIEHRTALNGRVVQVRGIVVATSEQTPANPSSGAIPMANANPQPRLFLADTSQKDRDKDYDLVVLLREGEDHYQAGETVEIKGVVEASKTAVYLRKTQ
ncbi:MAG: hypothetical protein WCB68_10805 [Pyrinomonadaceae bacterium]